MTSQISIKDVRNAIEKMTSNNVEVVCSEAPRMALTVTILSDESGMIYTKSAYQVDKVRVDYDENMPIRVIVRDFNAAMLKYDQENS